MNLKIDRIFNNLDINKLDKDSYDVEFLNSISSNNNNLIAVYGGSKTGAMALCGFKNLSVKVDYIIDDDVTKIGSDFYGVKIITPEELSKINKNTFIFISHNFFDKNLGKLLTLGFKKIFSCKDLWDMTDFRSEFNQAFLANYNPNPVKVEGWADLHYYNVLKFLSLKSSKLVMTNVDFCITERCSMKCKDCCNLMQYYEKPENTVENIMLKSMDRLMSCVDNLLEARVFGGDPFMNKEMYKYVNKLQTFDNIKYVVIYTNAALLPKGKNLDCLKNDKVRVHITDYGPELSKKKDEVISYCKKEGIDWDCDPSEKWDPIGKIKHYNESPEVNKDKFDKCCLNNLFQVLHGKVYRCPFSSHGSNMKFFPASEKYDFVNLLDDSVDQKELKNKIYKFYHSENYLTACEYCLGRGALIHGVPKLEPAIQTKKFIPFEGKIVKT